jgi:hypothetical protein
MGITGTHEVILELPANISPEQAEAARRHVIRNARDWPEAVELMAALGLVAARTGAPDG